MVHGASAVYCTAVADGLLFEHGHNYLEAYNRWGQLSQKFKGKKFHFLKGVTEAF